MIRFLLILVLLLILAGAAVGYVEYRHLTAGPAVVLPPPVQMRVTTPSGPLLPGGWTNSSTISLSLGERASTVAGADIELRHVGARFRNVPTASSLPTGTSVASTAATGSSHITTPVTVHLADGQYRWQARLHNKKGVSPWKIYRGVIRVDTRPPASPQISSSTDPNPGTTYHTSTMSFAWQDTDVGAGVTGYSYRLDTDPHGTARPELRTATTSATLQGLDTGTYYFHVRALDRAGNWGPNATFPVRIDVTPPGLSTVRFSQFQFDPKFDPLTVSFAVTRPATVVHVGVYRQSDGHLIRLYSLGHLHKGQHVLVTWHGKTNSGQYVQPGAYEVYIRATDKYGHSNLQGWRDLVVNYRHIIVSLSQQRLYAYDGTKLFLSSLVTTGNRALPTPTGTYHIMARFHPYTFISPWPKSSQYYYAPSKVDYAMLFRAGGYFIHDAPWRSAFGPGTNAQLGAPGTNYTGTHGCVNTPANVARALYYWAQTGTIVQVIR